MAILWLIIVMRVRCGHPRNSARHGHVVEVTAEAEQDYVDEIKRLDVSGGRFYRECTPGYYNNEGQERSDNGFFTGMYGGGSIRFFEVLENWRKQGEMKGLDVR